MNSPYRNSQQYKKLFLEVHAFTIVLMSTEVFMIIICQIHKLSLPTILLKMPLARVSGDDDYYHVINKKAEPCNCASGREFST